MMKEFKVGDKVECLVNGKGEVFRLKSDHDFCIYASFENGRKDAYTKDGKLYNNSNICLTHGTWKVDEIPTQIVYKKGELVWANLGLFWDIYRYVGKAHKDDVHFLGSVAVGSQHMNVSFCNEVDSKHIRKFKDNPYDIND